MVEVLNDYFASVALPENEWGSDKEPWQEEVSHGRGFLIGSLRSDPFKKTLETLLKCGSTENGACICMWLEQKRNRSIRACFQGNLSYYKRTGQKEKEKKTWFFFYPWDWNLHISAHSGNDYFTAPLAQTLNPLTHAPVVTNERWPLFRFWCHHLWLIGFTYTWGLQEE